ncbi:MAG: Mrp/NBP35 family ATP-binding protein [Clostridia bacterium]|nr:Mrp/NBP35 family ATP-binding protein [Clostridia bacterium]
MSEQCTHNCDTCGVDCPSRNQPESMLEPANQYSSVKKVIGVVSGKGGVGKSLVTGLLAVAMRRKGYNTAVLDADVTGPSIPQMFGLHGKAFGDERGILPAETVNGIKAMSVNLLIEDETDPVVWRGPVIAGAVKQFWTDVVWGDVDFMFVDMPPGTGDVPLTVFQSLPVDGIVIVASPQELVGMIVSKAAKMAQMMNIPVLALVENMSYVQCPDCGRKINVFGESHADEIAEKFGIPFVARIPIDPQLAAQCDAGRIEASAALWLEGLADEIAK